MANFVVFCKRNVLEQLQNSNSHHRSVLLCPFHNDYRFDSNQDKTVPYDFCLNQIRFVSGESDEMTYMNRNEDMNQPDNQHQHDHPHENV